MGNNRAPGAGRERDTSQPAPEALVFPIFGEALLWDLGYFDLLVFRTRLSQSYCWFLFLLRVRQVANRTSDGRPLVELAGTATQAAQMEKALWQEKAAETLLLGT